MAAVLIGGLAQIPAGEGRTFSVAGRRIAVFRSYSNEVFATQAECPHLKGPLADGLTGGGIVVCPLHERAYDLRTGLGLNGECARLSVYPVSIRDGDQVWLESTEPEFSGRDRAERTMTAFIRAAEIWVPTADKSQLVFKDGFYGPLTEFRAASEQMRFAFDEGLPGKAWATGRPVILKEFSNSYFKRIAEAKAAGLTCGTALPVFSGNELKAVLVLFCGDDEAHVGAIELWQNNPDESYEMKLAEGYYGTAEMFEFNSRHTHFPRGFGLPGRVWKKNMPLIVKDLLRSTAFLRWQEAIEVGINRGIGIPYASASVTSVLVLLSARDTPIARRFEIWVPNAANTALTFDSGDCDQNTSLAAGYQGVGIAHGEGTIGKVWQSEIPAINPHLGENGSAPEKTATAAGLNMLVALPFIDAGKLKAVVAWYL